MNTHSLCSTCYRHLEAKLIERDGAIWVSRTCPEHGEQVHVVENDARFYHRTQANRGRFHEPQNMIVLDVTDRCNLKCPHCYHMPDNQEPHKPISEVMRDVALTPEGFCIILGGAEPSIRSDMTELAQAVHDTGRSVGTLSNGVRFSERAFAKRIAPLLNGIVLIGLNHRDYHGAAIHNKQLKGIRNLNDFGVKPMLGYTAEYAELPDILQEALALHAEDRLAMVRLRFGANIGRHPDMPVLTISNHIAEVQRVCTALNLSCEMLLDADNTIYHQMLRIAGMPVRIIQWPDEHNMVMTELKRAPWAKFIDGPISNFCHQIVLRDAFVNKKMQAIDTVPDAYTMNTVLSLTSRKTLPVIPILNISGGASVSVATAIPYDNARYIKLIDGISVANLHGCMTLLQREALVRFWLSNNAIQDEREAFQRTNEVVHLGFDANGQIVAVNTSYPAMLDNGETSLPYWFYRQFVHPRVRSIRLSLALVRLTVTYLGELAREGKGPKGLAMYLENPKLYKRSGQRALDWLKMTLAVKDKRGGETWTRQL